MSIHISPDLDARRLALRMSVQALSARAGVPIATLRRLLRSKRYRSSYEDVLAVAYALGLAIRLDGPSADEFRKEQARERASAPGMPSVGRLLEGSGRELWSVQVPKAQKLRKRPISKQITARDSAT